MQIIESELFKKFPELIFGFSTKIGLNRSAPFYFNLSLTVGDDEKIVAQNRESFFNSIGLQIEQITFQRQIHSDIIKFVEKPGFIGESDAMITKHLNIGLAISSADCTPIFLYDSKNKIIAAVHSGWRGTQKKILRKTLSNLTHHFNSKPEDIFCFIGPSISQKNYEIGSEVAVLFDNKYLLMEKTSDNKNRIYLDVRQINIDMLFDFGIPENQIEISPLCTFDAKNLLHSYRRNGKLSGRSLGVIALKG